MIVVGAVFGAVGAWKMDSRLLGWVSAHADEKLCLRGLLQLHLELTPVLCLPLSQFILLCALYLAFEIGYIVWAVVKNYGARHVLWNIVMCAVLFITMLFARDLRGACGSGAVLGDSYGSILP